MLSEGQAEYFAHFLLCREVLERENEQTEPLENELAGVKPVADDFLTWG